MKAFRADWVCPVSSAPIRNGVVVVDAGRILEVSDRAPEGIDLEAHPGAALLPAFVNVHTHLELTIFRGFLENLPFPEWIRKLTRAKYEILGPDDIALSARLGAIESLAAGVATVGDVMDLGAGWNAMVETGLRGVAYQEVFGPRPDSAETAAADLERKVQGRLAAQTPHRKVGVSPHAPYTVSDDLYRRTIGLAERLGLGVAVHIAESAAEEAFVRTGAGPFAELWRARGLAVDAQGIGPLAYLDQLGVLDRRTLVIHAVYATQADIERMAALDVSIAHCPKSNVKLGHGIAPVLEFIEAGVNVGLGADSVASNNAIDMFEEMRWAIYLQRARTGSATALDAARALRMATLDGASCLGLERELGSLEAGKLADMIVVDLEDPAVRPIYDPVDALVYGANRRNVRTTILAGEPWTRPDDRAMAKQSEAAALRLTAAFEGQ